MKYHSKHYLFSPSAANSWVHCPASLFLNKENDTEQKSAEFGNETHRLAAELIETGVRSGIPESPDKAFPDADPDALGYAVEYAKRCLTICRLKRIFGGPNFGVERELIADDLFGGTPDFFVYDQRNNELVISDLKCGFGIVEPYENWSLICYAYLAAKEFELTDATYVVLKIYQPRASHIDGPSRTWRTTIAGLRPYFDCIDAAMQTAANEPALASSGEHCRYCNAAIKCEALQNAASRAVDVAILSRDLKPSPEQLAVELDVLSTARARLETREAAVSAEIEALLSTGRVVPNWSLGQGRGKTVWECDNETLESLGRAIDIALLKKTPITPKQAIKAGVDEAVVKLYSGYRHGKTKLVRSDVNRAAQIFGKGDKSE